MQKDALVSQVKKTFEDWDMYDAVIQHDYMSHQELALALRGIAGEVAGGLRVLDLGCGDAWLMSHALGGHPPESYLGLDLSESAVQRARAKIAPWGARAALRQGNYAEIIATLPDASANLILASYTLHHFRAERKGELARQCFRILAPGGVFCWIDPARKDTESREDYLRRLTGVMERNWTALQPEQLRHAVEHIWASDYPETAAVTRSLTEQAGFRFAGSFLDDPLFGAWKFVKEQTAQERIR